MPARPSLKARFAADESVFVEFEYIVTNASLMQPDWAYQSSAARTVRLKPQSASSTSRRPLLTTA
jgi:hypothetical protein